MQPAKKLLCLPLLLSVSVACGGGDEPQGSSANRPTQAAPALRVTPRSADPVLVELRALLGGSGELDPGRVDQLVRAARAADPVEADLLEARWCTILGEDIRASQLIEAARERDPADARVYATAAELHAAAGRLETSDAEIARGVEACGTTAELERAKGVGLIVRPGGARVGLELLQRVHRKDPELPFLARPLGQAFLLRGMRSLSENRPEQAYAFSRQALEFDPEDVEVRRFAVECDAAVGDFEGCLAGYRGLIADGVPLEAELALMLKRAGMAALLDGRRDAALAHLRDARNAGLEPTELGSGAAILASAAGEKVTASEAALEAGEVGRAEELAVEALSYDPESLEARRALARCGLWRGASALREGDAAAAEGFLAAALEQDPDSLELHQFLGHALYRQERFGEAAEQWQWVVDVARVEKLELPDPVILQLAQALVQDGRVRDARTALEEELSTSPAGPRSDEVRTLLDSLPDPDEGGR